MAADNASEFNWYDEYLFNIHRQVEAHGFAIQYVMGEGRKPSWGYTIGFLAHGHPEVIVIGLDDGSTAGVLHILFEEIRGGRHRPVGVEHDQEIHSLPVRLLPVPDEHWDDADDRLCTAVSYYQALQWHRSQMRAVQLVWASPDGRFPWDPGFPRRLSRLQPVLDGTPRGRSDAA